MATSLKRQRLQARNYEIIALATLEGISDEAFGPATAEILLAAILPSVTTLIG